MTIRSRLVDADDIVVKVGSKVLMGPDGSVASEFLN